MIQPTRTNLIQLKERVRSIHNSVDILKTKRQALIREFLNTTLPFLKSRKEIRAAYGGALRELALSIGVEGRDFLEALSFRTTKEPMVEIADNVLWGIRYRDVDVYDSAARTPGERDYDYRSTTPRLEESIHLFERLVDSVVQMAAYESKLKKLAEEIVKANRRTRVLEERVLPRVRGQIRMIEQYIDEREREAYHRLKRAKNRIHRAERRQ